MWDNYPGAVALGLTWWGTNAMAYTFGTWGYTNPYYTEGAGYNYSQPLVVQQTVQNGPDTTTPAVPESGLKTFEEARSAFHAGNYDEALRKTDEALKTIPGDAVIHEFRALVNFARGRYADAAAGLHAVLAVGPGWDWTTMSQLYPGIDVYTDQLRKLETHVKQYPSLPEGHFVLAYHYLTCGHAENAAAQLKLVLKSNRDDAVATRLLQMATGESPGPSDGKPDTAAPAATADVKEEELIGTWTARQSGQSFQLSLQKDGKFKWAFQSGSESQEVSGVFAVDGTSLALEPDTGGVLLAEIQLDEDMLSFQQVGAPKDAGMSFTRQ